MKSFYFAVGKIIPVAMMRSFFLKFILLPMMSAAEKRSVINVMLPEPLCVNIGGREEVMLRQRLLRFSSISIKQGSYSSQKKGTEVSATLTAVPIGVAKKETLPALLLLFSLQLVMEEEAQGDLSFKSASYVTPRQEKFLFSVIKNTSCEFFCFCISIIIFVRF